MFNPSSSSAIFGRTTPFLPSTSTAQRQETIPAQGTTNKEHAIRRFNEELEKLKASSSATLTKNENYAKALLIAVREEIYKKGYKSRNKLRPAPPEQNKNQWRKMETIRITKARAELHSIRALKPSSLGTNSYFFEIQRAINAQGHNCYDLALAGIGVLDSANFKEQVRMLILEDFDHAMILIGHIPPKGLPKNMEEWPSHLVICDPWGNIACSAQEYIPRVMEKMQKWERRGKKVYDHDKSFFRSPIYPELETDLRGNRCIYPVNTKPPAADKYGCTLLMHAAKNGEIEKLDALTKAGADLNAVDRDGTTALMFSVMANSIEGVKILLEAGADTKARRDGVSAFGLAAQGCNTEIMKLLIEAGIDKDEQMRSLKTLLERSPNSETAIKAATAMFNAGVDRVDALLHLADESTMRRALNRVIGGSTKKLLKYLLAAGADGAGAMLRLAQANAMLPLKRLVNAGADKIKTQGETALIHAIKMTASDRAGESETGLRILQAMLKAGADVTIPDNEGKNAKEHAIELAVNSGNEEALRAIEAPASTAERARVMPMVNRLRWAE